MIQDRSSWHIKGEDVLHELVTMMGLTDEECAALHALSAQAHQQAPLMAQAFYERLLKHANTVEYLKDAPLERLHTTISAWFEDLFSGVYGAEYVRKRLVIGHIHVRIGLPVRYPLAMLDVVASFGEAIAQQGALPSVAVAAFRKVLALDIAIFNQAYEDNQLSHLAAIVGGERLARLLLTGNS